MKKPAHWLSEQDSYQNGQPMNQVKMQNVEKHGHAAKSEDRTQTLGGALAVEPCQQNERRAHRHQGVLQRWWIFLHIEEKDQGFLQCWLKVPITLGYSA